MDKERFDKKWRAMKEFLHNIVQYRERGLIKETFYKTGRLTAEDRDEIITNISNYISTYQEIFYSDLAEEQLNLIEHLLQDLNPKMMAERDFKAITRKLNINFLKIYPNFKIGFWLFGYQKLKLGNEMVESPSSKQVARANELRINIPQFGDTDERDHFIMIEDVGISTDRIYAFDRDRYPRWDQLLSQNIMNEIPVLYPIEFITYLVDLEYITVNEANQLKEPEPKVP